MSNQGCGVILLVPHPDGRTILATDGGLPRSVILGEFSVPTCLEIAEALLGGPVRVLRISPGRMATDGEPGLVVVTLDPIGTNAPPGMAWVDRATAPTLVAADDPPEVGRLVRGWIDRLEHGPTALDPPWTRPGWLDLVSTWMRDRMADAGSPASSAPRVVYLWGISIVLRADSASGPFFCKVSTPSFDREAAVTALLAGGTPGFVTDVVAVDADAGWLLMRDYGGRELGAEPPESWAAGLEAIARLQHAWAGRTKELLDAGAQHRPVSRLVAELPEMHTTPALAGQLTPDEVEAWRAAVPAFVSACERLDAIGPSDTLVHGDLHPWNVALGPEGPLVFDWTDAAVGHPFCDLGMFVLRAKDGTVRRALRDAYLACWRTRLEPADLAEAGDLAILVSTLYQVQSYIELVAALDQDDHWDLATAAGSWARTAMATLRDGLDVTRPRHPDA